MFIQVTTYPLMFLLVLFRIAAVMGTVTFLGKPRIPARFRVTIAFVMAMLIMPVLPATWQKAALEIHTTLDLLLAILGELLLGFAIGLVCDLFIAVFSTGGYLAGFCSSLTMAGVIDPINGLSENAIGGLLQSAFVIFFVLSDGHLLLLKMLGKSFEIIPPQLIWLKKDVMIDLIAMGSLLFEWALKLAAPTVAGALILDAALGLMSRMAPDFDILFLSLPVRLFVGLCLVGITLKFGTSFFEKMAEITAAYAARIFVGLP